jgi:flagellar biosynthetic protein FliR
LAERAVLDEVLPSNLFGFFLVFARVGTALMLLPGFGETYISRRIRLLLGLAVAAVVTPVVQSKLPALPATPLGLFALIAGEIVIGLFLGAFGRILMLALSTAGGIIAYQASIANALVFDVAASQQGALVSAFLTTAGALLVFVSDLHLTALRAVVDSYGVFPAGEMPIIGDMANTFSQVVSESFLLAIQISAPVILLALVFYLGVGLIARLMPQVQVFFMLQPLQIALGLLVLLLTVSAGMALFLDRFNEAYAGLFRNG